MSHPLAFFQIGCGDSANYAGLIKADWCDYFDLPGILADTTWHGVLVDLQPAALLEMLRQFAGATRLTVMNAGIAGKPYFSKVQTRNPVAVDLEARLSTAGVYNDKIRPDFEECLTVHTIDLETLLGHAGAMPIGLLALDVQGSEVEILSHYSWTVRPCLIDVEPHSEDALRCVSDILRMQGYTFVRRRPDGRRRVNHLWRDSKIEDIDYW